MYYHLTMHPVLQRLSENDLYTSGITDIIALEASQDPSLIDILVKTLLGKDLDLQVKSSSTLLKLHNLNHDLLNDFVDDLIKASQSTNQLAILKPLSQIIPTLELDSKQIQKTWKIFLDHHQNSDEPMLSALSLTVLSQLGTLDPSLTPKVLELLKKTLIKKP